MELKTAQLLIGLMLIALATGAAQPAQAQSAAHLIVTVTGQDLTAGFNNNVTLTITNTYSSTLYDVDVQLTIPTSAPLSLLGGNHWLYDSVVLGQSVTINFQTYAPTSAIGSSYQATLTILYKQLGDVSYTSEEHSISFSVKGWISLVVYGVLVTPTSTTPGGNTTVSGSVLNKGNIAAYNANVTVESDILAEGRTASVYLGEIDSNIPRPFSVLVIFRSNLEPGNYTLNVKITAIDNADPASPYVAQEKAQIQVRRASTTQTTTRQTQTGPLAILIEIFRYLYDLFFGSTTAFLLGPVVYSYFKAATAFILDALHAG
jgi:hypothetical protein